MRRTPQTDQELVQQFGPETVQRVGPELRQGFGNEDNEPFGPITDLIGLFSSSQGVHGVNLPGINAIALPDGTAPAPLRIAFKTNTYNELSLEFRPIPGGPVRNRAVPTNQFVHALAYRQLISQIEGDPPAGFQHFEDGIWQWTPDIADPMDAAKGSIARLTSVPHGNSFLCWGAHASIDSNPPREDPVNIPDTDFTPQLAPDAPQELKEFVRNSYTTPILQTGVTPAHANQALIRVVRNQVEQGYTFENVVTLMVDTNNPTVPPPPHPGGVANIDFILNNANFTGISTTFWIETIKPPLDRTVQPPFQAPPFVQLQYTQNISLNFAPANQPEQRITFPHVDVNTLLRQDRQALPGG
ncbi:MAG: heme-binding protein [Pseudonocardiaceae bacterium]